MLKPLLTVEPQLVEPKRHFIRIPQNKETRQQLMAIDTLGKLKRYFDSLTDEEKREFNNHFRI